MLPLNEDFKIETDHIESDRCSHHCLDTVI